MPNARFISTGFAVAIFASSLGTSAGAATSHATEMVPLLGVSRSNSLDNGFIRKASALAISTMNTSQSEIAVSRLANAQGEAVRAFNTAAEAYNGLADLASSRGIAVPRPGSIFANDSTPRPIDGAPIEPRDIAYFNSRQTSILKTIATYSDEVDHGKDKRVVAFAAEMRLRLQHDLSLTTIGVNALSSGEYGDRAPESASTIH